MAYGVVSSISISVWFCVYMVDGDCITCNFVLHYVMLG